MQYIPCNSAPLAQETLFWPKKALFLPKDLQKVRKLWQILIRDKIAHVRAQNFHLSPNFSAGATCAPVQLLPPWIEDTFSFFRALLPTLTILQKTSAALQGLPWTLRTSARFFDSYISKYLEKYFACFKSYFSDMVRGATDVNRNHQNHLDLEKSSLLFK